ncbi:MAG: recombination protein O N-terminal domain-containing protein [Treponema sp.]|jgi:DNA repair protein RecO (recombination protein O)|nr:recombination protein O N-terminal domain-containing protein [Treponema sp.]
MERNHSYSALVLRTRPFGESNREAWFLTREEGILTATVFGGPKSKFRALVSPFHQGRLWVYHQPVRDSRKLTDFDVQSWRPGIREQYQRTMTAGAVVETILDSLGSGGNWPWASDLANGTLDALDGADEGACIRVFIHFLWNWLLLMGLRPDGVSPDGTYGEWAVLGPGARHWFRAVENLEPSQAVRYTLDPLSLNQAKALTMGLMARAIGKRPASWDRL